MQLEQFAGAQPVFPQLFLGHNDNAELRAHRVPLAPRNEVPEFIRGGLPGILIGAPAQNFRQRGIEADKFHQLFLPLFGIIAALQNDGAGFYAGVGKPRLGAAFQNGLNLEVR